MGSMRQLEVHLPSSFQAHHVIPASFPPLSKICTREHAPIYRSACLDKYYLDRKEFKVNTSTKEENKQGMGERVHLFIRYPVWCKYTQLDVSV